MKKMLIICATIVLGANCAIYSISNKWMSMKNLYQSKLRNFQNSSQKISSVKIQPFGAAIYNRLYSHHIHLASKQGIYFDFYLSPEMYNFFDIAVKNQNGVRKNPHFNLFHKFFLDPNFNQRQEWINVLSEYKTLITQLDAKYHHKFEDDIANYLSFFGEDEKTLSVNKFDEFYSLFDIHNRYKRLTLDPNKSVTTTTLRKQGAIFQIAVTNYSVGSINQWFIDEENTRIMPWNKANNLLSHYYRDTVHHSDGVLSVYNPSLYVTVTSQATVTIKNVLSQFYAAIKKQFDLSSYNDLRNTVRLGPTSLEREIKYREWTDKIPLQIWYFDSNKGYEYIRSLEVDATLYVKIK